MLDGTILGGNNDTGGMNVQATPVVIVPGLRDHVPEHWQTLLEQTLPNAMSVPRMRKNKLSRACWIELLDRTLAVVETPPILVAHSAGCMIVAHWAKRYERPIRGALLATPPDFERSLPEGYPTMDVLAANGWLPTPREPLPFPSIVATSGNDPLGKIERVTALAKAWGSRCVHLGDVGHLNPASGFGEWPAAETLIAELACADRMTTARRVQCAPPRTRQMRVAR